MKKNCGCLMLCGMFVAGPCFSQTAVPSPELGKSWAQAVPAAQEIVEKAKIESIRSGIRQATEATDRVGESMVGLVACVQNGDKCIKETEETSAALEAASEKDSAMAAPLGSLSDEQRMILKPDYEAWGVSTMGVMLSAMGLGAAKNKPKSAESPTPEENKAGFRITKAFIRFTMQTKRIGVLLRGAHGAPASKSPTNGVQEL